MTKYLLTASVLLLAAAPLPRRERPTLPNRPPPEVVLAEASEKEGAVWVRFLIPWGQRTEKPGIMEIDGKKIPVTTSTRTYGKWFPTVDLKVDGKRVQAFDVEGKEIAPKELLKRLAKRTHVVLFKSDPPDPFYLRLLRPDTLVFKAPLEKVTPPLAR
jgi:hypothetical protein